MNLIVDSLYVYQVLRNIQYAYLSPRLDGDLLSLFLALQFLLQQRRNLLYVAHIRSHQPFPGILQEGNNRADAAASPSVYSLENMTPWDSHAYFHQNKKALMKAFDLTDAEASAIVQQCPTCSLQGSAPPMGVNPRGLAALQVWQMDVTHYSPFSPWKYLHVSVDTFSGFTWRRLNEVKR